jgi:hypothetical protein
VFPNSAGSHPIPMIIAVNRYRRDQLSVIFSQAYIKMSYDIAP